MVGKLYHLLLHVCQAMLQHHLHQLMALLVIGQSHQLLLNPPSICMARLVDLILEKKEQRVATYLVLVASMVYWLDKVQAMLSSLLHVR